MAAIECWNVMWTHHNSETVLAQLSKYMTLRHGSVASSLPWTTVTFSEATIVDESRWGLAATMGLSTHLFHTHTHTRTHAHAHWRRGYNGAKQYSHTTTHTHTGDGVTMGQNSTYIQHTDLCIVNDWKTAQHSLKVSRNLTWGKHQLIFWVPSLQQIPLWWSTIHF